ncbi:MAG: LysE family translocator [Arenicellales bacterium]|jgi:threonine/homoserine/homoserine lactone efflux protein
MIDASRLPLFLVAAGILIVIPGPAVLYIVARSLDRGRLAGIVSALGVAAGSMVHIAAAALGLSALLASSALAFSTVKYLGAAYLIFLGMRRLMLRDQTAPSVTAKPRKLGRMFYEGMLVNLLNPKTALFFLAFLPQFVDPAIGPVSIQVIVLGSIFAGVAVVSDSVYALLTGSMGRWIQSHARFLSIQRWFSGGVYIALGLATALAGPGRSK